MNGLTHVESSRGDERRAAHKPQARFKHKSRARVSL
jgi:hypothetical protein